MPTEFESFARDVLAGAAENPVFPQAHHEPHGDTLEIMFENANFYGEPHPGGIVIYRDQNDNRVVGCLIEGLARFLEKR
jgi:hypothetical protein